MASNKQAEIKILCYQHPEKLNLKILNIRTQKEQLCLKTGIVKILKIATILKKVDRFSIIL